MRMVAAARGLSIGSTPYGFLIARIAGQRDIRSAGSGSIGATNVARLPAPPLAR